ncbi:unnamed protein product [Somion occarium]|uniref:Mediator of RNA polymerase II transcription subunit 4 n=1 Tax=Somion occarium TaxID=3059160 RepID=A0ABP1CYP9_9APHY
MEYRPRYPQPFTLAEAVRLDVPIIAEEISRLQNSVERLRATQKELNEAVAESPDPDFSKAIEENDIVIGSQEERVSMLKMALTEKGIPSSPHYDPFPVPPLRRTQSQQPAQESSSQTQTPPTRRGFQNQDHVDGGIDL